MRHANIAVFVPHAGCPHQCSFCDQRRISGENKSPEPEEVREILAEAVKTLKQAAKPAQIAFFGGSFTAIPQEYMVSLLTAAKEFIDAENIYGIRISTRPDAINEDILAILKRYGVTDIELGVQSMDNVVLLANNRGHTAEDSEKAANLIKSNGFGLGLQMMTGMYASSTQITRDTAIRLAKLKPDCVRIYPTVVLRGTKLAELYENGVYMPQPLDRAVDEAANLLEFFADKGINVIRLGLHDSGDLNGSIVAGPHHPAFRELCESRLILRKILAQIEENMIPKGKITIFTSSGAISKTAGHKRENIVKLKELGYDAKIAADDNVGIYKVAILTT